MRAVVSTTALSLAAVCLFVFLRDFEIIPVIKGEKKKKMQNRTVVFLFFLLFFVLRHKRAADLRGAQRYECVAVPPFASSYFRQCTRRGVVAARCGVACKRPAFGFLYIFFSLSRWRDFSQKAVFFCQLIDESPLQRFGWFFPSEIHLMTVQ